ADPPHGVGTGSSDALAGGGFHDRGGLADRAPAGGLDVRLVASGAFGDDRGKGDHVEAAVADVDVVADADDAVLVGAEALPVGPLGTSVDERVDAVGRGGHLGLLDGPARWPT